MYKPDPKKAMDLATKLNWLQEFEQPSIKSSICFDSTPENNNYIYIIYICVNMRVVTIHVKYDHKM